MQATFSFDVDTAQNLVRITLSGFFTVEDIAHFVATQDVAMRQLTCGANEHLSLVDIQDIQIQSKEALAEFGKVIHDPRHAAQRLAIVVSPTLVRTQVQRIAAGRDVRYFTSDVFAAEQWLLQERHIVSSLPLSATSVGDAGAEPMPW